MAGAPEERTGGALVEMGGKKKEGGSVAVREEEKLVEGGRDEKGG